MFHFGGTYVLASPYFLRNVCDLIKKGRFFSINRRFCELCEYGIFFGLRKLGTSIPLKLIYIYKVNVCI